MSDFLLVPTNVQAFVVGKPGDKLYDLAHVPANEEEVANWYVGNHRNRAISFDNTLNALESGIHLHWALPAALMRSLHKDKKPPKQRLIPNRWLVVRMWHAAGKPTTISAKAWVVESDYVSLDARSGASPFPFLGTNPPDEFLGMHCGHVGRVAAVDVSGWRETHEKYRFELNSSGWGDPSFAAYYPACKGVLGFHDKMDDKKDGVAQGDRVTYLVVGWYSDPAQDPLYAAAQPDTVLECQKRLASLGWSYSHWKGVDVKSLPQRTLCHGSVVGLTWLGTGAAVPATPAGATSPTVAIGGSAAEALVALLEPGKKELQQVLCAFQLGQATQVSQDDQLGDLLHRQSFGATPGGTFWTVEPVAPPAAVQSTPPPLSENVQELLGKLNEAQRALDQHVRKVESLRSRLFACWATWASKQNEWGDERTEKAAVNTALADLDDLNKLSGVSSQKEGAVKDCKDRVESALTAEQTGMQLAESTRPPFLHPKDPFVVLDDAELLGADRVRGRRLAEDANNPPVLDCRLTSDVVTGVELSGTVSRRWQANDVLPLETLGAVATLPVRSLALEALLFDPSCAGLIDTGAPQLFEAIQKSLEKSRSQPASGSANTLTWVGEPPDPLCVTLRDESNLWQPVYLLWQARWSPAYEPGKDPNSASGPLAGWQFDPGPRAGDLVPRAGSPQLEKREVLLEGATIISAISGAPLANNLGEFAKTAKLKANSMGRMGQQVPGQSLGGFNDLLLQQTLGLCLPPFDPTKEPAPKQPAQMDKDVWKAINSRPQPVMPVDVTENSFLPVRTGDLKLVNLYIVDCFGQTRKLIDSSKSSGAPTVIASAALPPAPARYHASFGPRLVQPARLNLDWQPAGKASLGPVCGWIVANYLEKSFAIFNASGKPLGSLESVLSPLGTKTIDSKVTFHWHAIPGSPLEIAEISNLQLRRFVSLAATLTADEGQAFLELVELVLRRTEGRVPAEDPAMAVLLGRPLALVQASLGLEVDGLPAGYWQPVPKSQLTFTTEGWEKLRVPVRLGGMNLPSDGLVGFMAEPSKENDPPCLFASDGATRRLDSKMKIKYDQGLTVVCADDKPVSLTLLMDASARVHATTGLLPRHQVSLPPEAVRLAGLINEFYFGVAPVLGERPRQGASQPTMPRPSDAFGQWSWATRPAVTAWHQISPADDRARFADTPALTEGWLRLRLQPNQRDTVKS